MTLLRVDDEPWTGRNSSHDVVIVDSCETGTDDHSEATVTLSSARIRPRLSSLARVAPPLALSSSAFIDSSRLAYSLLTSGVAKGKWAAPPLPAEQARGETA